MEDANVLQLKNKKFSDLYMCFCGYAKCSPLHNFGPAVRPNYIFHYILQGKGRFTVGEETYNLCAGQGFLIEPEVVTYYEADRDEPWTYLWIGFSGEKAEEYIQNHYSYPLQVGEIADYVGINRSYLYTLFKEQSGMSPKEYLTNFRITRAAQLLEITELSIESVAMSCGYQNTLGFSKIFKARMGVAPSVYKKRKSQQQKKEER